MRLFKKEAWDNIIYNLWYPGFLGSMIYDLLPQRYNVEYIKELSLDLFAVKGLIVLFFIVDYFHLYNDVHKIVSIRRRGIPYFLCDALASIFFLFSFFTVDTIIENGWPNYTLSAICIIMATGCIGLYKVGIATDRRFFGIWLLVVILLYSASVIFKLYFPQYFFTNDTAVYLVILSIHTSAYFLYVYYYYNRASLRLYFEQRVLVFRKTTELTACINVEMLRVERNWVRAGLTVIDRRINTIYSKVTLTDSSNPIKYDDTPWVYSDVTLTVLTDAKPQEMPLQIKTAFMSLEEMAIGRSRLIINTQRIAIRKKVFYRRLRAFSIKIKQLLRLQ